MNSCPTGSTGSSDYGDGVDGAAAFDARAVGEAPYLDAVLEYARRRPVRFTVPGHRGGHGADPGVVAALGLGALQCDVPRDIAGVDLGAGSPFERAEAAAARAHGARRSWFLTNGATQGNHVLCLALAGAGSRVLVQRNAHGSVLDGLVLSDGRPSWLVPRFDRGLGVHGVVEPRQLEGALRAAPGTSAAFLVSPTYFGAVADVETCAQIAHAAGAMLVVDQSWGPHFGFSEAVPRSALELGADVVLTSTHKLAGSLTQSAMLHLAPGAPIEPDVLGRWVRLTTSTSASALLMLSLDGARRQLEVAGAQMLGEGVDAASTLRTAIGALDGYRVPARATDDAIVAWDPLRLVVDVTGTGLTGFDVAAAVREHHDIHLELATTTSVVAVLGTRAAPFDHALLVRALADVRERGEAARREPATAATTAPLSEPPTPVQVLSPRAAAFAPTCPVAVEAAVGRVAAEVVAAYPPGIPAIVPGERVTPEALAHLTEARRHGARLHGAADGELRTIRCVEGPEGDDRR